MQALRSAHYALSAEGLVQWTLADIPRELEEAYVLCGASIAAQDWGAPASPTWFADGLRMVQTYVHIPISGPRTVEDF